MLNVQTEYRQRVLRIIQILDDNWIGASRALIAASNEFKHWQPGEVEALFRILPDIEKRKLSPHGPGSPNPPRGAEYRKEIAMRIAMVTYLGIGAISLSPLALVSRTVRKEWLPGIAKLNYDVIMSSFFVKCPVNLLRQVANAGMAVCVNRYGQFSVRGSGYAAISHVWAETMGLSNGEIVGHDDRGINYTHFSRILSAVVVSSNHEWFWLDLLAVPQIRGNEQDVDMLRELKTNVVNSLIHVYRNADSVIVLDSLTLQLDSVDLCTVAAILSCGRWLTRMWTYQEVKLARRAQIVTKAGTLDFHDMVRALDARARHNKFEYAHWHGFYLEFSRLLPSDPRGVSLADIAFCCTDRGTGNDIDYARSLFALLNLQWQTGWQYEEAILHIMQSRPQDAARIAHLQGWRGLPPPYSWAPRYLAQLTGIIIGDYTATENGLTGSWTTFRLNRIIRHDEHQDDTKLIFHMEVLDRHGEPFEMWSELPRYWSDDLNLWLQQARPSGTARLLCARVPENLYTHAKPVVMLMVLQGDVELFGKVVGTATLNDDDVTELDGEMLQWLLT